MAQPLAIKKLVEMRHEQKVLVPLSPLTFEEFVDMFGEDDDVELINGVVVKKMAARIPHEDLFGWLYTLLRLYAKRKDLGIVLGSRAAVKITEHRGRLPDVLFVRKEKKSIVKEKGIYGAPDLVIEIVSPRDRPTDIVALEADYRSIGVSEVWFIDQKLKRVRVLRKKDGYQEEVISKGIVCSEIVEGFWLKVEWLFAKPLPLELDILNQLLGGERG
ncbi:Uma2 family endonuclease [Candidatus Poribacteria bacterium]|nr:Uma2 family endonuclease [Candidatus Poribacteria bacterium]